MTGAADVLQVPPAVQQALLDFVRAAEAAFGADLRAIVLFGSAAEGRLRATSDVNLLVVLSGFEPARAEPLGEPLRKAQAAIDLRPMFVLESELPLAATAFAQKFADITRRHQVLFGADPFAGLQIPREALRARLLQTTLNLAMRLRAGYVARIGRDEQLALLAADAAGPLRVAAAALLDLEGEPPPSPKEALERVAAEEGEAADTLTRLSQVRETRVAEPGAGGGLVVRLIALAQKLHDRARRVV